MIEATKTLDYYEFLQISPHADAETIHRVYRYLAARFHPDNPETGDPEKFFLLKSAYDVLSDQDRRSEYDRDYDRDVPERTPLSESVDFMDQVQGELNRRLAVLAVLYYRRRSNPFEPKVSLAEIEKRMGFPRDYLDFTTWYLSKKGYITRADNSDFSLTAEGVDFIETQRVKIPVLNKLLTTGNRACNVDLDEDILTLESASPPMVVLPDMTKIPERRANARERRTGAPDWRAEKAERRKGSRRAAE
ncbi:MAG: DnaJ domain-containing protein [Terracidiphilus sp.]